MGMRTAYFDNAATTFPKPIEVYDFADSFYRTNGGNIGRGNNTLAANASHLALQVKENLLEMYHCPARQVVFTSSATDALNRILLGLSFCNGDNVYVTPFEHNAVTRPLNHLKKSTGINIRLLDFNNQSLLLDLENVEREFEEAAPSAVVMTQASNVCGAVVPVLDIARIAKRYGAIVVIDMSQSAGLIDTDLSAELVDFAVFAGHKSLMGSFGIGGFICDKNAALKPILFGGNGINSVEQEMPKDIVQMVEVGSLNTYAIAALKASTDYILNNGIEQVNLCEEQAQNKLLEMLRSYENVSVVCDNMSCQRIGVVSALFDGLSPDEAEFLLGKFGVSVRSGLHCSPYAHRFLGTLPSGTVRFSVSPLTCANDFKVLKDVLDLIRNES